MTVKQHLQSRQPLDFAALFVKWGVQQEVAPQAALVPALIAQID